MHVNSTSWKFGLRFIKQQQFNLDSIFFFLSLILLTLYKFSSHFNRNSFINTLFMLTRTNRYHTQKFVQVRALQKTQDFVWARTSLNLFLSGPRLYFLLVPVAGPVTPSKLPRLNSLAGTGLLRPTTLG